jgi:hypothetical protein
MQNLMVRGSDIKSVRLAKKLTQPQFSRWLSKESGEPISSQMVNRMENFRNRDAYQPKPPSPAISEIILRQHYYILDSSKYQKVEIALNLLTEYYTEIRSSQNPTQDLLSNDDRVTNSGNNELGNENLAMLTQNLRSAGLSR